MEPTEICIRSIAPSEYAMSSLFPDGSGPQVQDSRWRGKAAVYNHNNHQQHCDFLTLITAISNIYCTGQYIRMLGLNDIQWDPLAVGRDFQVGSSSLALTAVSVYDQTRNETLHSKLIVKKIQSLTKRQAIQPSDMSLFVRELSILHHLRDHENIVRLRGVGWIYDYLEDEGFTPCPKPAILLEEATGTLKWLIEESQNLSVLTEMKICRDVASGLLAVHRAGLLHGDVKPANVLVFKDVVLEEGVELPHYKCKISDFSLASAVDSPVFSQKRGTRLFMAPEMLSPDPIPVHNMLSTDVWSLGILFAHVTQRDLDLQVYAENTDAIELAIHQSVHDMLETSTLEPITVDTRRAMFKYTIRRECTDRNLDAVVEWLKTFFEQRAPLWNPRVKQLPMTQFVPADVNNLYVSYENFKLVSGQVHDAIVSSLLQASDDVHDSRQAKALWELAVISLSGFAGHLYTQDQGLIFLRRSATLGDIRAQGIFYRVQKAMTSSTRTPQVVIEWLERAATFGHQVAIQDLHHLDPYRMKDCRYSMLTRHDDVVTLGQNVLADELVHPSTPHQQHNGKTMTGVSLHIVRAVGDPHDLEDCLTELSLGIDSRDTQNNTLLIEASRYGNYATTLRLLELGADILLNNNFGENFLHFAAHFTPLEFAEIMVKVPIANNHRVLLQEAKGIAMDGSRDLFPLPPGTPLERAVSKNNIGVVSAILEAMTGLVPSNGLILRRSLLLALRLQYDELAAIILDFIQRTKNTWEEGLPPIWETRWEYKGQKRSFVDAILVGGVSGFGLGADLPLEWWRLCHLGRRRFTAQDALIDLLLSLPSNAEARENLLDSAFDLIISERFSGSLRSLLDWKARITDGKQNRIQSLVEFIWNFTASSRAPDSMQKHLDILNKQPFRWFKLGSPKRSNHSRQRAAHKRVLALNGANTSLEHKSWQILQPINDVGHLEQPMEIVNYVDQIHYHNVQGTLLQQSIHIGDRLMFQLLVHVFGASYNLPAPGGYLGTLLAHQSNVYSLLARAAHNDLWFAKQFRSRGIGFDSPFTFTPCLDSYYLPPLLQALCCKRWAYAQWLLQNGASLSQQTRTGWSVLSTCLTTEFLSRDLLEFLFPLDRNGGAFQHLPRYLRNSDGFQVFQYVHDCFQPFGLVQEKQVERYDSGKAADFMVFGKQVGYEEEGLNKAQCESGINCTCFSCAGLHLSDSVWSATYLRERLRSHETSISKELIAYFLEFGRDGATLQQWKMLPRIAQCWHYLLEAYPDVSNYPPQQYHHGIDLPITTLSKVSQNSAARRWYDQLFSRWLSRPSILAQSLDLGPYSYVTFALTVSHFQDRARWNPSTLPFPTQKWYERLCQSPLDYMTADEQHNCIAMAKHKYRRSATDFLFTGPLFMLSCALINFVIVFRAWHYVSYRLATDLGTDMYVVVYGISNCILTVLTAFAIGYLCCEVILHRYMQKLKRSSRTRPPQMAQSVSSVLFTLSTFAAIGMGLFLGNPWI